MALLSVIIPAYNAADTIDACLESVLASSGINSEIICVNDGSTDGTGEIMQQWEQRDNRIRCMSQPKSGVVVTRRRSGIGRGGLRGGRVGRARQGASAHAIVCHLCPHGRKGRICSLVWR